MSSLWDKLWKVLLAAWVVGAASLLLSFRLFSAPSSSMLPTLHPGDTFLVSTTAYGVSRFSLPFHPDLFAGRFFGSTPKRGDVVVFALPRDTGVAYIKRVIGLPGDTVQMKDGRLVLNGVVVPRTPVAKVRAADAYGHDLEVPTYTESLPEGASYAIIEIQGDTGFNDNTASFKVPTGSFFVLGDNRDNSTDSRIAPDQGGVGFVPLDNLIGRAQMVVTSNASGPQGEPFRQIH